MQTFKPNFASEKEKYFIEKLTYQHSQPTIGMLFQSERYSHLRPANVLEENYMVEPGEKISVNIYNTFQSRDHIGKNPDSRILVNKANIQAICSGLLQLKENGLHQQHQVVIYLGGNREVVAFAKERIELYLAKIAWDAEPALFVTSFSLLDKKGIYFVSFFYDEFQMHKKTALDIENSRHVWSHWDKNRFAAGPREPHDDFHTFIRMTLRWLRSNRGLYFNLYLDCQSMDLISTEIRDYLSDYLQADLNIKQDSMKDAGIDVVDSGDYVSFEYVDSGSIEDYVLMQNGDPDSGIIAISSPLGRCLLGCQTGDEVQYSVMDKTHRIRILHVQKNYARKHNF